MARLCLREINGGFRSWLVFAGVFVGATVDQSAAQTLRVDGRILPPTVNSSVNGATAWRTDPGWLSRWTTRGAGQPTGGGQSGGGIDQAILNNGSRLPLMGNPVSHGLQITLVAPTNGAQLAAGSDVALRAKITESVVAVEFYDGAVNLGRGIADDRFSYHLALPDGLNAGPHSLRARATDVHALIVWSPAVAVMVTSAPRAVPSLELVEPEKGAIYSAGSALVLRAVAEDSAGRVRRVEFFDEQELIATVPTPTPAPAASWAEYVSPPWIVDLPGPHHLHARAYAEDASFSESPPVSIRVIPTLPYVASFEAREKYQLGSLQGQLGWKVARGSAAVSEVAAFDGVQSVELSGEATGARAVQIFGASVLLRPTFVDLAVRPVAGLANVEGTSFDFSGARVAFVSDGSTGRFAVPRGDQPDDVRWTLVGPPLTTDSQNASAQWTRLTARLDYQALTWDLFVDGRLAGVDLALERDAGVFTGFRRFSVRTGAGTTSLFDFLFVGFENPLFADSDGDGMEDAWERANALDPTRNDRAEDRDADGLTNLEEYLQGTRADLADTDADGLPDAWEIRYHLDPLHPAGESSDADLDGLDDLREFLAGTDPTNPDSDGDGMPDGWEAAHGLVPLRADSAEDADEDGVSNLEEYRRGTDPMDFFDGLAPRIQAPNGAEPGAGDELALIAQKPDGAPWANAPVVFRITSGSRRLTASAGRGPYTDIIELRADANGLARVYLEPLGP